MTFKFPFKKNGFAVVTLMLFLPLFFALLFSLAFVNYIIQYKTKLRTLCITESTAIQKNLIRNEESLFKLNPLAEALRMRLALAQAELVAAHASENPVWIVEVEYKISQIKTEQLNLDSLQQSLIQKTKIELQFQSMALQTQLQEGAATMGAIWQFYFDSLTTVSAEKTPHVSVKRDSPDPAPIYELGSDYFEAQRLAYRWQHRFQTKQQAQKLLNNENDFEMFCSVSARKERTAWELAINAVKY